MILIHHICNFGISWFSTIILEGGDKGENKINLTLLNYSLVFGDFFTIEFDSKK